MARVRWPESSPTGCDLYLYESGASQAGETGAAQERSVEEMTKQYSEELAKRTEGKRRRAEEEPRRGHPISEECQAWKAARLVSTGGAKVPRLRSGCRVKPAPKAGIEIGAETGQPRAVQGEVGGATAQQGLEEARGDTQGEEVIADKLGSQSRGGKRGDQRRGQSHPHCRLSPKG